MPLTLTLLMAWVGANNVDLASSFHDFAVLTDSFNAGADLHRGMLLKFLSFLEAQQYMDYGAKFTRPNFVRFAVNSESYPDLLPASTK
jgi:hypothetical protein